MPAFREGSVKDNRQDAREAKARGMTKAKYEASKADKDAKRTPTRDGLRKYAKGIKVIG